MDTEEGTYEEDQLMQLLRFFHSQNDYTKAYKIATRCDILKTLRTLETTLFCARAELAYKAQQFQASLPHSLRALPEVDGHVDAHFTDCFSKQGECLFICRQRSPCPVFSEGAWIDLMARLQSVPRRL